MGQRSGGGNGVRDQTSGGCEGRAGPGQGRLHQHQSLPHPEVEASLPPAAGGNGGGRCGSTGEGDSSGRNVRVSEAADGGVGAQVFSVK